MKVRLSSPPKAVMVAVMEVVAAAVVVVVVATVITALVCGHLISRCHRIPRESRKKRV